MTADNPLHHEVIVVEQVRKDLELRNRYGLHGTDGQRIRAIGPTEQSPLHFLVRIVSDLDVALPTTVAILDQHGRPVLRLHEPWSRWAVHVHRADRTRLGTVTKRWHGLVTETFTDADTYVVDLRGAEEPMRRLAPATALSVDVIMKGTDR